MKFSLFDGREDDEHSDDDLMEISGICATQDGFILGTGSFDLD